MRINFYTLAIRGAEESSILIHAKTIIGLLILLTQSPLYEVILEDIEGEIVDISDLEEFIPIYNTIEDAQFELRLYSNQSIVT